MHSLFSYFLICTLFSCSFGKDQHVGMREEGLDVYTCNMTADCIAVANSCQLSWCDNDFCLFTGNLSRHDCCESISDCEERDSYDVSCKSNTCTYDKNLKTQSNIVIGAIVGFGILGILMTAFCMTFFAYTIQNCKNNVIIV